MITSWLPKTLVFTTALCAGLIAVDADRDAEAQERPRTFVAPQRTATFAAQERSRTFRVDCPSTVRGTRNIVSEHAGWGTYEHPTETWYLQGQITGRNMPLPRHYQLVCQYGWHKDGGEALALKRTVRAASCSPSANGWNCSR